MQQFDPNIPPYIQGDVTTVVVVDPASDFPPLEVGNHVLDRTKPFQITVKWTISGLLAPLWLSALGGGPEILLAEDDTVAADPTVLDYEATLNVPAFALEEGDPGSNTSGIYKLVISVFLNSTLPSPGFDMVGFNEGPIIQVEDPA